MSDYWVSDFGLQSPDIDTSVMPQVAHRELVPDLRRQVSPRQRVDLVGTVDTDQPPGVDMTSGRRAWTGECRHQIGLGEVGDRVAETQSLAPLDVVDDITRGSASEAVEPVGDLAADRQ
jgi:hypothetical protein